MLKLIGTGKRMRQGNGAILESKRLPLSCTPQQSVCLEREDGDEGISNRAAAAALGIEPVQLRIWKRTIDQIRDQPKGSRRNKKSHPCAFPEMEREVTLLFGEKRGLGRRIGDKWLQRQARLTFEELYPHKVTTVLLTGKRVQWYAIL
jgi:hypothetical protein